MPNTTVPAAAEGVSTIRDLYTAWYGQQTAIKTMPLPDHIIDAAADQQADLASRVLAIPSTTVADLAMKLIACTDNGADLVPGVLIDEAHKLLERQEPATQDASLLLQAEDLVYECKHLSELIYMAVDSMELDIQMKALSAGIYVIQRKLLDAAHMMDIAKRPSAAKDSPGQH